MQVVNDTCGLSAAEFQDQETFSKPDYGSWEKHSAAGPSQGPACRFQDAEEASRNRTLQRRYYLVKRPLFGGAALPGDAGRYETDSHVDMSS